MPFRTIPGRSITVLSPRMRDPDRCRGFSATVRLSRLSLVGLLLAAASPGMTSRAAPALDYEFFKSRVEPIFLKKRAGHTRCYVCHSQSNNAFRLEKLSPGSSFWTEEQSRRNFENVSALVNPGDPATSFLLLQPLAPEGGGNAFHSGGRQFASKHDPDWKTLARWVSGAKLAASPPGR
jgi:hypothetical protein